MHGNMRAWNKLSNPSPANNQGWQRQIVDGASRRLLAKVANLMILERSARPAPIRDRSGLSLGLSAGAQNTFCLFVMTERLGLFPLHHVELGEVFVGR